MKEITNANIRLFDWNKVAQSLCSWKRVARFLANRVPQIFLIWAAVGLLLKLPLFISAFAWFARQASSPLYRVDSVSADQPVDMTPIYLIGFAELLVVATLAIALYACIKLSYKLLGRHPGKVEEVVARFADKITDELSSMLTHCSAAILVLLASARMQWGDPSTLLLYLSLFAVTFIFAAVCYREDV